MFLADRGDQQHVGAVFVGTHLEIAIDVLPQHERREGPKRLAELDLQVHHRLHRLAAGVAEDAPRRQRPGPNSIRPWNQPTTFSWAINEATVVHQVLLVGGRVEDGPLAPQHAGNLLVGERRAQAASPAA